jgi:hypothetical protein
MSLFERWLEIEKSTGKSMSEILAGINASCGTNYKHNWPSDIRARGGNAERIPLCVRRYMMSVVLPVLIKENVSRGKIDDIKKMLDDLT